VSTIVCYGDSNTRGTDPATYSRFPLPAHWTGVFARELGDAWHVAEEGLRNRTTDVDDPSLPHHDGSRFLPMVLETHAPVAVLIIALGTSDLKARYGRDAFDAAAGGNASWSRRDPPEPRGRY